MKKISRTVAMILVLVMLASSFTGCTILYPVITGNPGDIFMGLVTDIVVFFVLAFAGAFKNFAEAPAEGEAQIYLASAEYNPLTEYYSLRDKMNALPEMASVTGRLDALSETERSSLMDKVYALPKTEFASSVERLNALSEAKLAYAMRAFSALSEAEFASLMEQLDERLNTTPMPENVAMNYGFKALPETEIVSLRNDFKYNMGLRLCLQ